MLCSTSFGLLSDWLLSHNQIAGLLPPAYKAAEVMTLTDAVASICGCSASLWLHMQVRMSVNRNQDLRMNAGRAAIELEYDIGFDDSGKIHVSSAHSCFMLL